MNRQPGVRTEVVLFDLGGVLVELTGIQQMLEWCGGGITEERLWQSWLASEAVRRFESGGCDPATFADSLVEEMQLPVPPSRFLAEFERWPSRVFPGADAFITSLREGYRTACLSNTNTLHWSRLQAQFGLGELFDQLFVSHETGLLKPDAAAFRHVIQALGCEPAAILFVDDNPSNVAAARAEGMASHLVRGFDAARSLIERELGG